MGLGLKDSEDEEDLITQKEQLEDEELEEDEERGIVPFGEKEQKLLQRFEKYLHSDDEEVHPDEEMGNIVSDKAWGKKKSIFYHTDYVDDEMGGTYVMKLIQYSFVSCVEAILFYCVVKS